MMLIRVTDNNLRASLLVHLIEQLERGDLSVLLEKGVCPASMDRLRSLTISDILHLASSGWPDIHFSIDENGFDLGIALMDRRKEEAEQLVYYIQNGSSQSMLNQLFPKTDPRIIQTYRKLLKSNRKTGRAALPDEATRDLIHKCWFGMDTEYPEITSLREKLMLLHGFFNSFPLDVLHSVVNEFNEPEGKRYGQK
jgi:hypothetical protein